MLALITGTALHSILPRPLATFYRNSPFGAPSAPVCKVELGGQEVLSLTRHGLEGSTAAHLVNYRANLWVLKELGATRVVATATVGGIDRSLRVGDLVVPSQIVDYTYGREQTYVGSMKINHFDLTSPFDATLRNALLRALPSNCGSPQHRTGTYAVTQGPRFETAAEIERYSNDGCTLVGMTLMPEASLARELDVSYAAACLVVNAAAGVVSSVIDISETATVTEKAIAKLKNYLELAIEFLH